MNEFTEEGLIIESSEINLYSFNIIDEFNNVIMNYENIIIKEIEQTDFNVFFTIIAKSNIDLFIEELNVSNILNKFIFKEDIKTFHK